MDKVDICFIIPCKNSKTINNAVESICNQNNHLVSFKILICVQNEFDETILFLKNNKFVEIIFSNCPGVTANRNAGLLFAKSDFVYFLDSDDTLVNSFFNFFSKIKKTDFDMAFGGGINFSKSFFINSNSAVFSFSENHDDFLSNRTIFPFSYCTYIFRTKFLQDNNLIVNNTIINSEDFLFVVKCISKNPKLLLTNALFFSYTISNNSLSKSNSINDCICALFSFNSLVFILDKLKYNESLSRTLDFFLNNTLRKGVNLNHQDYHRFILSFKKTNLKKYILKYCKSKKTTLLKFCGLNILLRIIKAKESVYGR